MSDGPECDETQWFKRGGLGGVNICDLRLWGEVAILGVSCFGPALSTLEERFGGYWMSGAVAVKCTPSPIMMGLKAKMTMDVFSSTYSVLPSYDYKPLSFFT
jgi:hypothetical protein